MSEIKILKQTKLLGKDFVVYGTIEEPLFLAKDVAAWIGHSNPSQMLKMVDEDEKVKMFCILPSISKDYKPCVSSTYNGANYCFLTENGVYEVLMLSKTDEAKQFKRGVKKILHEIRTKGGYIATQQEDTPESIMARALKIADETLKRHRQRVRELEFENRQQSVAIEQKNAQIEVQQKELTVAAPKVRYYDDTLASVDYVTTQQIANEIGMNANVLSKKLEEVGVLYSQSKQWLLKMPYKTWNLHGTRTFPFIHSDGTKGSRVYTVWNQRGRRFIIALYNNDFNIKAAIAKINGEKAAQSANNQSNN